MNAVLKEVEAKEDRGLYDKYSIRRTDNSCEPGGRNHGNFVFAMDASDDPVARRKVKEYALEVAEARPQLAADIRARLRAMMPSEFVTVPETTLPNGTVVPAFEVGRYLATVVDGKATVQADAVPETYINYHDAIQACENAGMRLITETQYLALSWNLYNVGANWTSGTVGEGDLRQGLHLGNVDEAQSNDYEPEDPEESRIFYLSNGEPIFDAAGHLYSWVFDDVQGDERGIVAKAFTAESPSISTAPYPSMERGAGWQPSPTADWSGDALVRGGRWRSVGNAGVFNLDFWYPGNRCDFVGFRCTK